MEEAGVNTREIMELGLRSGAAAQLPATPAGCSTPLAAALVPFPALRSEWIDRGNGEISSRS